VNEGRAGKIPELCAVNLVINGKPMRLHRPGNETAIHSSLAQRAILVVSPGGRIQFATRHAARWLKDFSFSPSGRLPDALAGWLEEIVAASRPARFILDRAGTQLCFQVVCREPDSICLLLEERTQAFRKDDMRGQLTRRQIEVLSWVARGKTNAEIGEILSLKTGTIGKYLERIFPKLGVENRTAAASFVLGTNETG
jgi:DNA-binding CsgD family transcriptional regulator